MHQRGKIRVHKLKCLPQYFQAIIEQRKRFDARENDRGFREGDLLWLQEYDPENHDYTGREVIVSVPYILEVDNGCGGPLFGLLPGYVVMSIQIIPWPMSIV